MQFTISKSWWETRLKVNSRLLEKQTPHINSVYQIPSSDHWALLPSFFNLLKTAHGYKTCIVPAAIQSFMNPRSPAQYKNTQAFILGRDQCYMPDVFILSLHSQFVYYIIM